MSGSQRTTSARRRIAVVHSYYSSSQPSGENAVVDQQVAAMRAAGHEVAVILQRTDDRASRHTYPLEAAFTVASGFGPAPLRELAEWEPDVVQVHNLFPNFGRRWVRRWDGALLAVMHNFRPLCAAGTFYRDGQTCTDCLDRRSARPSLAHGCYRGSRLATVPLAASLRFGSDPILDRADRVVTLNETMRQLYARAGVPADRLALVPNFLSDPGPVGPGGDGWLYVGRLSPEKGVARLMAVWPEGVPLTVVGSGPDEAEARRLAPRSVRFLGSRAPQEVADLMRESIGLVFPSRWYEGAPMVYLEALAAGTPVLAWRPSSVADLVDEHTTGLVVDDLKSALAAGARDFPSLRPHVRDVFEARYTASTWLSAMDELMEQLVDARTVS